MDNKNRMIMTEQDAIVAAEQELSVCRYIAECTRNSGMRAIHRKRCEWLSVLVGLAKKAIKAYAVEVVRCEKCCYSQALPTNIESAFGVGVKHCQKRRGNNTNPFGLSTVSRDDFCSYGERREGE